MEEYYLEDEVWDEAWENRGVDLTEEITEMKDKDSKLFIFVHANSQEQQKFLTEALGNNCFAQPVNFMVLQAGKDHYTNKIYHRGEEVTTDEEMKRLWNNVRPYLTISNANPDRISEYCNWTYLESIIETGWERQFPGW